MHASKVDLCIIQHTLVNVLPGRNGNTCYYWFQQSQSVDTLCIHYGITNDITHMSTCTSWISVPLLPGHVARTVWLDFADGGESPILLVPEIIYLFLTLDRAVK